MPSKNGISILPLEVQLQIAQHLPFWDKKNLSSTCKLLRKRLIPDVFKSLVFDQDEDTLGSVLEVVRAHGSLPEAIEFGVWVDGRDEMETPMLLPGAGEMLRGTQTPNLNVIQLNFDYDDMHFDWSGGRDEWLQVPEIAGDVTLAESSYSWRALINETWRAVSANKTANTLVVDGFIPVRTSTYSTPDFKRFLGQIQHLSLQITSDEDLDPAWPSNLDFRDIFHEVGSLFLSNLTVVESLYIDGNHSLLGLDRHLGNRLLLQDATLPTLRKLTLRNYLIRDEVLEFVRRHGATLAYLDVEHCFGIEQTDNDHNESIWAAFFDEILRMKPALTRLDAGHCVDGLAQQRWKGRGGTKAQNRIASALRADPRKRHFCYAKVDRDSGHYEMDSKANCERFADGHDWAAYRRLMQLVEDNNARALNVYNGPDEYWPLDFRPPVQRTDGRIIDSSSSDEN